MTEFAMFIVDWKEAKKRHDEGELYEVLLGEIDPPEKWIQEVPFWTEAPADYFDMMDAWEGMTEAEGVPAEMHKAATDFVFPLITSCDYHNDLEEPDDAQYLFAAQPSFVAKLDKLAAKIDFSLYAQAFATACSAEDQERLARGEGDAFKSAFLPFMKFWAGVIADAARQKRGLIAVCR